MNVKVFGTGCTKCKTLHKMVLGYAALDNSIEVEYISDINEMMNRGIMSIPVLMIDEEVKCIGRVPKDRELKELIFGSK
jgi:small redox-active disulfide protein 2